jgi:hypothetical protein
MSNAPAAWQPDPTRRHQYRYWDGAAWTEHVADDGATSTDPPTMDTPAAPSTPHATMPATSPGTASPTPPPGYEHPARKYAHATLSFAAIGGGALLVIGSFLDAARASIDAIGFDTSKNYMDGDGPLTLVCGLVVCALALLAGLGVMPHWGALIAAGFGGLGALIAVIDMIDVQNSIDDLDASGAVGASASIGPALWVCLVGGVLALVLGLLAFTSAKSRPPAA